MPSSRTIHNNASAAPALVGASSGVANRLKSPMRSWMKYGIARAGVTLQRVAVHWATATRTVLQRRKENSLGSRPHTRSCRDDARAGIINRRTTAASATTCRKPRCRESMEMERLQCKRSQEICDVSCGDMLHLQYRGFCAYAVH